MASAPSLRPDQPLPEHSDQLMAGCCGRDASADSARRASPLAQRSILQPQVPVHRPGAGARGGGRADQRFGGGLGAAFPITAHAWRRATPALKGGEKLDPCAIRVATLALLGCLGRATARPAWRLGARPHLPASAAPVEARGAAFTGAGMQGDPSSKRAQPSAIELVLATRLVRERAPTPSSGWITR